MTAVEHLKPRRLLHAGALDLSFGIDGHSGPLLEGDFRDLAQTPDGGFLMVGQTRSALGKYDLELVKTTADGAVDGSFGTNGRIALNGYETLDVLPWTPPDDLPSSSLLPRAPQLGM